MAQKRRNKTRSVTIRLDDVTAQDLERIIKQSEHYNISKILRTALTRFIMEYEQGRL